MKVLTVFMIIFVVVFPSQAWSFGGRTNTSTTASRLKRLESLIFHGLTFADFAMSITHVVMKGCEYEPEICEIKPQLGKLGEKVEEKSIPMEIKTKELENLHVASNNMSMTLVKANRLNKDLISRLMPIRAFPVEEIGLQQEVTHVDKVDIEQTEMNAYTLLSKANIAKENVESTMEELDKYSDTYTKNFLLFDLAPSMAYYTYLTGTKLMGSKQTPTKSPPTVSKNKPPSKVVDTTSKRPKRSITKTSKAYSKAKASNSISREPSTTSKSTKTSKLSYMKTALGLAFRGGLYAASIANFVTTAQSSKQQLRSLKERKSDLDSVLANYSQVITELDAEITKEATTKVELNKNYIDISTTFRNITDFLKQMNDFPKTLFESFPSNTPAFTADDVTMDNIVERQKETLQFVDEWADTLVGVYKRISAVNLVGNLKLNVTKLNAATVLDLIKTITRDEAITNEMLMKTVAFQYPKMTNYNGVVMDTYRG